jgi:hypothetical protein
MDDMEVDTSNAEHGDISPSASFTENHPESQHAVLVARMNDSSVSQLWPLRMELAGDNTETWRLLFTDIIQHLTAALADTDLCNIYIPPKTQPEAKRLIEHFNDTDLNQWQAGVQKGVKSGDWDDLIAHRTYNLASGDLLLKRNSGTSETSSAKYLQTRIKVRSPKSTQYNSNLYYLKGGKGPAFRRNVS